MELHGSLESRVYIGLYIDILSTVFVKASDNVSHKRLIIKFDPNGSNIQTLYLECTAIHYEEFSVHRIIIGIRQGSILHATITDV